MRTLFLPKNRILAVVAALGLMLALGIIQLRYEVWAGRGGTPVDNPQARVQIDDQQARNRETEKSAGEKVVKEAKQNEFFVEYRLERDRTRSQQIDLLREIVNNQNSAEETRKEAQKRLLAISQAIDTEMRLENLIRAENFKDALAFIQDNSATIIVQTPVLTPLDKNRISEIAVRVTGLPVTSIVVIAKM